jgi:GntR family transcriptional regulator of arabinose operon
MTDPKYMQLAEKLRGEIQNGTLTPGQRLPGENQIAAQTGFSRQTVRQALHLLEQEELTVSMRGSGTYVREDALSQRTKQHNIAIVPTYIRDYIFPSILYGIDNVLAERGCASMLTCTHNHVGRERDVLLDLLNKPIDGLIVEGTKTSLPNPNIDLYLQFAEKKLPVVFINSYYPELEPHGVLYVTVDDEQGGRTLCERLIRQGHRHIAGLFKSDDLQGMKRYAGYSRALVQAGLPLEDEHVVWFTTENRSYVIEESCGRLTDGCTAVVCYNDEAAYRLIQVLTEKGIRVPDDVTVVSFDNTNYAQISPIPFYSLEHPKAQLGRVAAQKLMNVLNGRPEKPTILPWGTAET